MAKPLDTIKKMRGRSVSELLSRGGQAVSAYRDQMGLGERDLSDGEFFKLLDRRRFRDPDAVAERVAKVFFQNADEHFFRSFVGDIGQGFRDAVGNEVCDAFVSRADLLLEGRFDLLGYKNLYVGTEVDWHLEPISGLRAPVKHWKEFDELDTSETGDKKIVWELNRHQHFFILGVAYTLTRDERYAFMFVEHLLSWIEQNPCGVGINWTSSLEAAFRSVSWVWALNLFRHSAALTPEILKEAVKALYLHGRHIEKYLSKYYSPNTHLTGEALALYYLGTQLPFLQKAKHWTKLGSDILLDEITKQILPDGVYFEQSTWYQRYTVDFYSHFFVLRSLAGDPQYDKRNLAADERYFAALEFMMYITRPDGTTPLIGDDDGGRMLPITMAAADDFRGSLALGASILGRGEMKYVARKALDEVFWLTGSEGVARYAKLNSRRPKAASREFAAGGYMVMRDGWADTDTVLIVDHGEVGSLSGGHGHADALSIDLSLNGRTLLVDPGTYSYHESREMRDLFRMSAAHNTATIDDRSSSRPSGVFRWGERAETQLAAALTDARFDHFAGQTRGFDTIEGGAAHEREILFLKNDYIIIRDLIAVKGSHECQLNFHYAAGTKVSTGIDGAYAGSKRHRIFCFGDEGRWLRKESWVSREYGNKTNAPFLRYLSTGRGMQEFFTFIMPVGTGRRNPIAAELSIVGGRAFIINFGAYTDVFVVGDGEMLRTELFDTNFHLSWARLTADETIPEEFVLIGGDRLRLNERDIFDGEGRHASVSIRRFGSDLYINADGTHSTVSIGEKCPEAV